MGVSGTGLGLGVDPLRWRGGFMDAAIYHQARTFAERMMEAISSWWAG